MSRKFILFIVLISQLWIFHGSNSFECTPNSFTNQSVGLYIDQWLYSSRFSSKNWNRIPKATCNCTSGTMAVFASAAKPVPIDVYNAGMLAFFIPSSDKQCPYLCACNNDGNCYRPYGNNSMGFDVIPYCEDNYCAMYLATNDEVNLCNGVTCNPGHLIDEHGRVFRTPMPFEDPVGKNSGYPVISSIGCHGCEKLKGPQCSLHAENFFDYRIPTGLAKVDDDYMNSVRLRHLAVCVIDTLSMILAIYLIVWKSNKEMGIYRWFLLNISIWAYLTDLNLSIFYVPLSIFPAPGICILGIARFLGNSFIAINLPFILFNLTVSGSGTAIVCAIYFRYRAALNKPFSIFKSKTWLICMGIVHLIAGIPSLLTYYISNRLLNGGSGYSEVYLHYQDVSSLLYKLNCGTIKLSNSGSKVFLVLVFVEILGFFIVAVVLQLCIMYLLPKMVKNPSQNLRKYQKSLMRSLLIQSIVPIICLMCPYIFIVISLMLSLPDTIDVIDVLFLISSLHSTFNTLVMIVTIKPYRGIFLRPKKQIIPKGVIHLH